MSAQSHVAGHSDRSRRRSAPRSMATGGCGRPWPPARPAWVLGRLATWISVLAVVHGAIKISARRRCARFTPSRANALTDRTYAASGRTHAPSGRTYAAHACRARMPRTPRPSLGDPPVPASRIGLTVFGSGWLVVHRLGSGGRVFHRVAPGLPVSGDRVTASGGSIHR
jgi:hypothetical protein